VDAVEALYRKQLDFRGGEPQLPVRLMEGGREVTFVPRGRMRMRVSGPVEKLLEVPAGTVLRARVVGGVPAQVRTRVQLAELPFGDKEGLAAAQAEWEARGVACRVHTLGGVFGISGKVIDNRRQLLLTEAASTHEEALRTQAALLREHRVRTHLFEEVVTPPRGLLEVLDAQGAVLVAGEGRLLAETLDGAGFHVRRVEFAVGYENHGFADRAVRGALQLSPDRNGRMAVVNVLPLEALLYGLVPSEIFARAHPEALKAQAVTARGEVLAKVGTKHLADPYLLCSEQHCAVYSGRTGEHPATTAAVDATRGEGLFDGSGRLVDSVYSAVCGGHTEHNEHVWGGPPNASLRGRPDGPASSLQAEPLGDFLAGGQQAYCQRTRLAQPTKFRWTRRIPAPELDRMAAGLGVGRVEALTVVERGVSGRARLLTVSGDRGASQVRGELAIRRLFGMLNSALFTVTAERDAQGRPLRWVFRGGGWGHGVGMCQTGAIGRAEAGQDYRAILRHYFNGAEVAPLY
jgi:SpoIID/LytB domain protein